MGKKLTTWWPDCTHDISCHNSESWPQRNWNKPTLKINCASSRWCWLDLCMTNFKMSIRAVCAGFACSPLLPPIKALAHWSPVGGFGLWTGVCLSFPLTPLHPVAGIWQKANLPFHQPWLFIGFRASGSQTTLSVSLMHAGKEGWLKHANNEKKLWRLSSVAHSPMTYE